MKIYVNELHQIKAIRVNTTGDENLKEVEVENDFLQGFCDTLIKSFCYHKWTTDEGAECISVYPYKDYSLLESIQEQNDIRENQVLGIQRMIVDLDLRASLLEYDTKIALNHKCF